MRKMSFGTATGILWCVLVLGIIVSLSVLDMFHQGSIALWAVVLIMERVIGLIAGAVIVLWFLSHPEDIPQ